MAHTKPSSRFSLILIWDRPLRLFHWSLALAISVALITGFLLPAPWLTWHLTAGVIAGALVIWRIVWGFTGTTYSRFRSFVFSVRDTLIHTRGLLRKHDPLEKHEAGHNPLGSLMVFALLAVVVFLVATGTFVLGGILKQGPLKAFLSFAEGRDFLELHEMAAWILLGLIFLHLGGVVFESLRLRDNLARAMITGYKKADLFKLQKTVRAKGWLAVVISICLGAIAFIGVRQLNTQAPYGVVVVAPHAVWQKECSDCHFAFPPSLLPAKSWQTIMANLDDHFGENAQLDPATTQEITNYLVSNSAETTDTKPANIFRKVDATSPLEITATSFWKRKHGDLPKELFTQKTVGAKQNCLACHRDAASGMFAPQNISIPGPS